MTRDELMATAVTSNQQLEYCKNEVRNPSPRGGLYHTSTVLDMINSAGQHLRVSHEQMSM